MIVKDTLLHANKVLVLCAHTDDEYGCAGTIIRILKAGAEVHYIALSRCEESVPEGFPVDVLEKECRECGRILGLKPENIEIWDYKVRYFPTHRQEILEEFIKIKRSYNPDLVLVPSSSDTHQDHQTIYAEGFRAFKDSSILGYEVPYNLRSFENTAFIRLSSEELDIKVAGLSSYKSQLFRACSQSEFIKSLARVRGGQCNADFAEAFELIRLIV